MNRATCVSRDIASLKAQIKELEMRKPFLREILDAFSQLLIAGAQLRTELETLPDPGVTVPESSRLSEGLPLLSGVDFRKMRPDPAACVLKMLAAVGKAFQPLKPDTDRLLTRLHENPKLPAEWLGILIENREEDLTASARALASTPETFRFLLEQALKPFLQWLAEGLRDHVAQIRWDRGYCPPFAALLPIPAFSGSPQITKPISRATAADDGSIVPGAVSSGVCTGLPAPIAATKMPIPWSISLPRKAPTKSSMYAITAKNTFPAWIPPNSSKHP